MSLELEDDIHLHHTTWRIRRVAWIGIGLLLAAALIGALGPSRLSRGAVRVGPATAAFDRIARRQAPTELDLTVRTSGSDPLRVRVARSLVVGLGLERIEPEPIVQSADQNGLVLTFARSPVTAIRLFWRPTTWGRVRGTIQVGEAVSLPISTLVLP